jgi:hypothetical protein
MSASAVPGTPKLGSQQPQSGVLKKQSMQATGQSGHGWATAAPLLLSPHWLPINGSEVWRSSPYQAGDVSSTWVVQSEKRLVKSGMSMPGEMSILYCRSTPFAGALQHRPLERDIDDRFDRGRTTDGQHSRQELLGLRRARLLIAARLLIGTLLQRERE